MNVVRLVKEEAKLATDYVTSLQDMIFQGIVWIE